MTQAPSMNELLGSDSPKNWGKWGAEDEVGSLNYLTSGEVLKGVRAARQGKVFTLQVVMAKPGGDPVWPGRRGAEKYMVLDEGDWEGDKGPQFPGGLHYADDFVTAYLQGSTQYDALGHVWYDGHIWNGYDSRTTIGGLSKASVLPIGERGIVGRGVLIDMARHRNKQWLDKGETFTHEDLMAAAKAQGVTIDKRSVLVIRTGFIEYFYTVPAAEFYDGFNEPGLTYSRDLVTWFQDMEIPNLVTDTIANEVTYEPGSGVALPLHCALMRNLGVTLTEICHLGKLAEDCAGDGQWDFLYAAAPLKVYNGTGSPVNPVVIK
ncbi:MAG: cyclase family protein [Acidimicrobiales bacterium]